MTQLTNNQQEEAGDSQLEAELWPDEVEYYGPPRPKYWLHIMLFVLTFIMAMIVGARMQENFLHHQPLFIGDLHYLSLNWLIRNPKMIWMGLPFALSLLGILLAHELGHYLLCLRYGVDATLPFFIPAPIPAGTFGAFIQIRSPFRSRNDLFDIAIGGPIAGFLVAVPVAAWGLAHSLPVNNELTPAWMEMRLGVPFSFDLIDYCLQWMNVVPPHQYMAHYLYFHPVAIAAWVGMLATMLNLLPGGQLDGGHILKALSGRFHRFGTLLTILILIPLCWKYWFGWFIWAVALWITREHPPVIEYPKLKFSRKILALAALCLFILSFMPAPVVGGSFPELKEEVSRIIASIRQ